MTFFASEHNMFAQNSPKLKLWFPSNCHGVETADSQLLLEIEV